MSGFVAVLLKINKIISIICSCLQIYIKILKIFSILTIYNIRKAISFFNGGVDRDNKHEQQRAL